MCGSGRERVAGTFATIFPLGDPLLEVIAFRIAVLLPAVLVPREAVTGAVLISGSPMEGKQR